MNQDKKWEIRPALLSEWEDAMLLAWRTFDRFLAEEYTPEGIRNFQDFVTDEQLKRMFVANQYHLFCAFADGHMVGIVSLRERAHISLLFVDSAYHRQGIGMRLLDYAGTFLKELKEPGMTVNASTYAVNFYHAYGFEDLRPKETKDGITYTPMVYRF